MPITNINLPEENNTFNEQARQTNSDTTPIDPGTTASGLSTEEQNDPNNIQVTISDPAAPIIILFGPAACGKTMTLVRLTRYLQSKGYLISPVRTFRPSHDRKYAEICDEFDSVINDNNAAEANSRISFMLVEIIKNGKRLCQILEAPGEYYFNPQYPNNPFPNYVNTIIASSNRKIWTVFIEPDWKDQTDRLNYVSRIKKLNQSMRSHDKTLFVFNKIDKTNFVRRIGDVNTSAAINEIKNLYPNIFVPFLNQNPITRWFRKYNCDFVPFQTGTFTATLNGVTYQEGPDEYCHKLWNKLMSKIHG